MEIRLMCRDVSGSVAFSAGLIEGLPAPARRYEIADHAVVLAGYDDFVLHHDAAELLSMGDLYRLPTPAEQDAVAAAQQAASTVQENTPADAPPDTSQDSGQQPAQDAPKKKSSGG